MDFKKELNYLSEYYTMKILEEEKVLKGNFTNLVEMMDKFLIEYKKFNQTTVDFAELIVKMETIKEVEEHEGDQNEAM